MASKTITKSELLNKIKMSRHALELTLSQVPPEKCH